MATWVSNTIAATAYWDIVCLMVTEGSMQMLGIIDELR